MARRILRQPKSLHLLVERRIASNLLSPKLAKTLRRVARKNLNSR